MKSSFKLFPVFQFGQKLFHPPRGGGWPEYMSQQKKQSYDKTLKELEKSKETKLYTAPHRGKGVCC